VKVLFGAFWLWSMVFSGVAQASEVAYADLQSIFYSMPERKTVETKLKEYASSKRAALGAKEKALQDRYTQIMKQVEAGQLSPVGQQSAEQELMKMQSDLQQAAATAEQDVAKKEAELMKPLNDKVLAALEKVRVAKGLDLILDASLVAAGSRSLDVTDAVKQAL